MYVLHFTSCHFLSSFPGLQVTKYQVLSGSLKNAHAPPPSVAYAFVGSGFFVRNVCWSCSPSGHNGNTDVVQQIAGTIRYGLHYNPPHCAQGKHLMRNWNWGLTYKKHTTLHTNKFLPAKPSPSPSPTPVSSELISDFLLQVMWGHVLLPVKRVHHLQQTHVQQPAHHLDTVTLGKSMGCRRGLEPLEVGS